MSKYLEAARRLDDRRASARDAHRAWVRALEDAHALQTSAARAVVNNNRFCRHSGDRDAATATIEDADLGHREVLAAAQRQLRGIEDDIKNRIALAMRAHASA